MSAKKQMLIALFYLLLASSLGILLRLFPVTNVDANYKYVLHTHSHIALLGWVYVSLTSLIYYLFIKKTAQKKFRNIFYATHITIVGMLFSFPVTGYALFSILFSTLFLICSYWFYFLFKKYHHLEKKSYIYKFINTSLIFMTVSSLGPWALGIIMNTLGNTSPYYKNAIYFYLHFQYNGWFIFCLLGIFIFILEKHKIHIHNEFISPFYKYMVISGVLTLFLSFLWMKPNKFLYFLSGLGVLYQLFALGKLQLIFNSYKIFIIKKFTPSVFKLLKFIYFLFILKIVLQTLTIFPFFAELVSYFTDFVIGYLHLTFLGIVSLALFVFFNEFGLIKLSKLGVKIYLLGFILSEVLIFYKGICNWFQLSLIKHYFFILVIVSSLMFFGVSTIIIQGLRHYLKRKLEIII
ncbi:hypothetical protein [Polaribacter aquimarinus]|nr:hypothetical protein [Polaribacter aquimarinus]